MTKYLTSKVGDEIKFLIYLGLKIKVLMSLFHKYVVSITKGVLFPLSLVNLDGMLTEYLTVRNYFVEH